MRRASDPTLRTGLAGVFGAQALVAVGILLMVAWNIDAIFARLDVIAHFIGLQP